MDEQTERDLELLELARRLQRECALLGCGKPRTGEGYLPPGDPGWYCEAHGDAL